MWVLVSWTTLKPTLLHKMGWGWSLVAGLWALASSWVSRKVLSPTAYERISSCIRTLTLGESGCGPSFFLFLLLTVKHSRWLWELPVSPHHIVFYPIFFFLLTVNPRRLICETKQKCHILSKGYPWKTPSYVKLTLIFMKGATSL